ncbi:hypothetical protein P7K49_031311 [Saguinus oedipus]|uniref:Uncharacterized protein n=1 Tax=Saguinus oedipus TaxID=9490 RepID=A0ABQ9TZZ1_SAGOE|nr:hypothetical protein P7K49_031311 [Saguinus oedipus]
MIQYPPPAVQPSCASRGGLRDPPILVQQSSWVPSGAEPGSPLGEDVENNMANLKPYPAQHHPLLALGATLFSVGDRTLGASPRKTWDYKSPGQRQTPAPSDDCPVSH